MPLGKHALLIAEVVASLHSKARAPRIAGADGATEQQPGTRANGCTLAAAESGPRRCADRRGNRRGRYSATGRGLSSGHSACLLKSELPAYGIVGPELVERLVATGQDEDAGARGHGDARTDPNQCEEGK